MIRMGAEHGLRGEWGFWKPGGEDRRGRAPTSSRPELFFPRGMASGPFLPRRVGDSLYWEERGTDLWLQKRDNGCQVFFEDAATAS